MNVAELIERLERVRDKSATVKVLLSNPSVGPRATADVQSACVGGDWNAGQLLLIPDEPVKRESEDEAVAMALWRKCLDIYASLMPPLGDGSLRGIGRYLTADFKRIAVPFLEKRRARLFPSPTGDDE